MPKAVDSLNKKTTTLGQALLLSIVGSVGGGLYLYFTGTSRQNILLTGEIMFVVFGLYFLFAFNVWDVKAGEGTAVSQEANVTRHPLKRRLSLAFWAIGFGGAVLFTCFWIFGLIFFAHSRRAIFVTLFATVFGILLAREALKMFLEEKKAR